jgi:hypothetical protein
MKSSSLNLQETCTVEEASQLLKFTCLPYRQDVELQHVDHAAGFSTLRLRIREIKRFTIFDIDADTAMQWGTALIGWAETQQQKKGEAK